MTNTTRPTAGGTALVTGATSGLGRGVARALADRGWTVLVHGRDKRRCEETVAELTDAGAVAHPYLADLASLGETFELARAVAADHPRLELLVNNAGVGFGANARLREVSRDGHELRLAVNYLAPVLLARRLRAPLAAAGGAQVVNVGSVGQSPLDFADPQFQRGYEGSEAYRRSKFALAAFTFAVADAYAQDGIRINCLHPGTYLDTGMTHEARITPWTPVSDGIEAVLHTVGLGLAGTSGIFLDGQRPARADSRAYDERVQRRLAELTEQLLPGQQDAGRTV